jgi:hypothetical protein
MQNGAKEPTCDNSEIVVNSKSLTDTQVWQVTQLLANADKISDSVKGVLQVGGAR